MQNTKKYAAWRQGTAAKRMPSQEIEDSDSEDEAAMQEALLEPSGVWRKPLEYLRKPAAPPVSSTATMAKGVKPSFWIAFIVASTVDPTANFAETSAPKSIWIPAIALPPTCPAATAAPAF